MDVDKDSYQILSYKSVAQMANNMTFSYYYYKLMLIARALFEWKNLPNNMDDRWIEKSMNDPVIVFISLNFLPVLLRYN